MKVPSHRFAFKLLGVGIIPGFPFKRLTCLGKALAQRDSAALGVYRKLMSCNL